MELLRLLVFTTIIAQSDAFATKRMTEDGFQPADRNLLSTSRRYAECRRTRIFANATASICVSRWHFPGAGVRLQLSIEDPQGRYFEKEVTSTYIVEVPDAVVGEWTYGVQCGRASLPELSFYHFGGREIGGLIVGGIAMSLARLMYYSAIVGGWAAFFGWLIAEVFVLGGRGDRGLPALVVVGCLVGAAIGAGLNVVAGMTNARLLNLVMRVPTGLIGGGVGGAAGIFMGQLIYSVGMPRALGFMFLGIGVGIVEGLYERSPNKIPQRSDRRADWADWSGGFLFDPISASLASASGIASRATAFVILGISIGALVGFVQVVLKDASLRVLDGYGVGREIISERSRHVLRAGRSLASAVPGPLERGFGQRAFEDPSTTRMAPLRWRTIIPSWASVCAAPDADNYEAVRQPRMLRDGDVIRLGSNLVRFSQRKRKAGDAAPGIRQRGRTSRCLSVESDSGRPAAASNAPSRHPQPLRPPGKRCRQRRRLQSRRHRRPHRRQLSPRHRPPLRLRREVASGHLRLPRPRARSRNAGLREKRRTGKNH
jgi:hypothetical protein